MDVKKLVSHRGDNTNYPENSYAGTESALKAGARFVEFDVQMNADHSLIVIHDTDLKRTANSSLNVFELTDAATSEISVHDPYQFGEQHQPTPISSLDDILRLIARYPEAQAMVEVKRESIWFWGLEFFMTKFLKALKSYESQSIIISFGLDTLEYTKAHSKLKTGFVFYDYHSCNYDIGKSLKPDYMICSHLIIPKSELWKGSWQWVIYSINEIERMREVMSRKDVDLVETDNICLMIELFMEKSIKTRGGVLPLLS